MSKQFLLNLMTAMIITTSAAGFANTPSYHTIEVKNPHHPSLKAGAYFDETTDVAIENQTSDNLYLESPNTGVVAYIARGQDHHIVSDSYYPIVSVIVYRDYGSTRVFAFHAAIGNHNKLVIRDN